MNSMRVRIGIWGCSAKLLKNRHPVEIFLWGPSIWFQILQSEDSSVYLSNKLSENNDKYIYGSIPIGPFVI